MEKTFRVWDFAPKNQKIQLNRKSRGSKSGSFYFCQGGEEKSPYGCNFITGQQNMLDAIPTPCKRTRNVFYEPFLMSIQHERFPLDIDGIRWLVLARMPQTCEHPEEQSGILGKEIAGKQNAG
jgi:hypothetical protein